MALSSSNLFGSTALDFVGGLSAFASCCLPALALALARSAGWVPVFLFEQLCYSCGAYQQPCIPLLYLAWFLASISAFGSVLLLLLVPLEATVPAASGLHRGRIYTTWRPTGTLLSLRSCLTDRLQSAQFFLLFRELILFLSASGLQSPEFESPGYVLCQSLSLPQ